MLLVGAGAVSPSSSFSSRGWLVFVTAGLVGKLHLQRPLPGMVPPARIERHRVVKAVHGLLGIVHMLERDEGTSPMAVGVSVADDGNVEQGAVRTKDRDEVRFGHPLGHLADEELGGGCGWGCCRGFGLLYLGGRHQAPLRLQGAGGRPLRSCQRRRRRCRRRRR